MVSEMPLRWLLVSALLSKAYCESILDSWWTYDPTGAENWKQGEKWDPDWKICGDGRRQSPISIFTDDLVYSPSLRPLSFSFGKAVSITVKNTGQNIVLNVEAAQDSSRRDETTLTVANGPLSYTYQVTKAVVKFGSVDDIGSEHRINNKSFSGELQFFGFNMDLYESWDEAQSQPHGLVGISVFISLTDGESSFESIMEGVNRTLFKGESWRIDTVDLSSFLPDTDQYLTYEGSLPFPACYETVTWVVLNAPIYANAKEVEIFRAASRFRREDDRRVSLANNFRATKELNRRTVLTNINFLNFEEAELCDVKDSIKYSLSFL